MGLSKALISWSRRLLLSVLGVLSLAACSDLNQIHRDINDSIRQVAGTYTAPLLAGSSRPSDCSDAKCRSLDEMERVGYEMIRRKEATYTRLVDGWYQARARLFPDSNDGSEIYEYKAFQRLLAEQVDAGRVSESQWTYLVERKLSEIRERQRSGIINCNTRNVGSALVPNYQTTCR